MLSCSTIRAPSQPLLMYAEASKHVCNNIHMQLSLQICHTCICLLEVSPRIVPVNCILLENFLFISGHWKIHKICDFGILHIYIYLNLAQSTSALKALERTIRKQISKFRLVLTMLRPLLHPLKASGSFLNEEQHLAVKVDKMKFLVYIIQLSDDNYSSDAGWCLNLMYRFRLVSF